MTTELVFGMVGGLGLFLYGMNLLSEGLQKITGDRIQKIIEFDHQISILKNIIIYLVINA